jgi:5,10-methylenetetrahydromethanopterin reductase
MSERATLGMCFDRTFPAPLVTDFARRLEDGGADTLWVIEDCFYTAGVSLAAAALTATQRITVGIGILPAVARNPAITAMEIATLCSLAPGRVLPGIGHGVQEWMAQMGARPSSPLTALEEVLTAVRRLLDGEEVTMDGRAVHLDRVRLDQPPADPPPLLAGVRAPKSLALSGRVAGGVVLAEPGSPAYVRGALDLTGRPDGFTVAVFASLCVTPDRALSRRIMSPWVASLLDEPSPGLMPLPFYRELSDWYSRKGLEGLPGMPDDWWAELGPIGTHDDALAFLEALDGEGVHHVGLYPAPDVEVARGQVDDVLALCAARR